MSSRRIERVQEVIKRLAGEVILHEISDPRMGFITVTGVKVSPDMRQARVYVSILGSEADVHKAFSALKHAEPYVQKRVAPALTMKYTPEVTFVINEGLKRAQRINKILGELASERRTEEGEWGEVEDEPPDASGAEPGEDGPDEDEPDGNEQ